MLELYPLHRTIGGCKEYKRRLCFVAAFVTIF
ncbi:hypothetical protein [Psychrobacter sp. H8-1]